MARAKSEKRSLSGTISTLLRGWLDGQIHLDTSAPASNGTQPDDECLHRQLRFLRAAQRYKCEACGQLFAQRPSRATVH